MIVLCVLLLFLDHHHLPNDCSSFSSAHISSGHLYCFSVNPAASVIFCTSLLMLFNGKMFFSRRFSYTLFTTPTSAPSALLLYISFWQSRVASMYHKLPFSAFDCCNAHPILDYMSRVTMDPVFSLHVTASRKDGPYLS